MLCINKMDLVDYVEEVYNEIHDEFTRSRPSCGCPTSTVIPVSALKGDNVVTRSENMPWYDGPSLLHHLENVHVASDRNLIDVRFPVQYVIRPQSDDWHDYRGYAGQVAGGVLKKGDEVMVLPSGFTSRIASVETADGEVDEAFPPMSVTIRLEDEIDVSRGDMICRPNNAAERRPGHRRDDLLDGRVRPAASSAASTPSSTRPGRRARSSRRCTTGSTSTRCTATRRRTRWRSTRSAGSRCARRCR